MNYKVKVLGVQGINNKVYTANEIVSDSNFPEGNAKKLAEEGKLEAIAEKEAIAESEVVEKVTPKKKK